MTLTTKIKTVNSTSTVTFTNISGSYYDMIINIQSTTINQSIIIKDTEGNDITEQPIVLTRSVKIILKDQKIGYISFADTNSYTIIISYSVKREASGIPYIDFDYSTSNVYSQNIKKPATYQQTFTKDTTITPIPSGKMWKIKSIAMAFKSSTTETNYIAISIIPPNNFVGPSTDLVTATNVYTILFDGVSVTSGDIYSVLLSTITINKSSFLNGNVYTTLQILPTEIELFSGYGVFLQSDEPANVTSYTIEYTEEDAI